MLSASIEFENANAFKGPGRFRSEVAKWLLPTGTIESVCGRKRCVAGTIVPRSVCDVQLIMSAATRAAGTVQIFPYSKGRNWGFGSKLPLAENVYALDLSRLNRIRSTAVERHSVELEAGVTQGQLDEWLGASGHTHFFNVTGAGLEASVIGNALERGIGYSGSRYLDLLDLEIVLPSGEVVRTSKHGCLADLGYAPTLGPEVGGLFAQSNFGVVTAARLRLFKRPERMGGVLCRIHKAERLPQLIDGISELLAEGVGYGVPHIFNRERIITSFAPHMTDDERAGLEKSAAEWTALLPVKGSHSLFNSSAEVLEHRLGEIGEVEVLSDAPGKGGTRLSSLLQGRPTDFPLASVAYSVFGTRAGGTVDLDGSPAGLIHITPMVPLEGTAVVDALRLVSQILRERGYRNMPLSLNAISSGVAVLVISLGFDRQSEAETMLAQSTADKLTNAFAEADMLPYRLYLGQGMQLPKMERPWSKIMGSLQRVFDPAGCMAESKYSALWST